MSGSGSRTKSVRGSLRDVWAHRPVRPNRGDKIAGVCAAIGMRYGIDPIIVRIGFVVATLYGGVGILLYLLGWLFLPKQTDDGTGTRPTSGGLALMLSALLLPAFLPTLQPSGLAALAACALAFYLLHTNYKDREITVVAQPTVPMTVVPQEPTTPNTWVYPGTAPPAPGPPPVAQGTAYHPPTGAPSLRDWEAAPYGWDAPEPPERTEPGRSSRSWITYGTLLLALITGLAAAINGWGLADSLAVALGVLGLGMVGGSFFQSGRGLIGFAIPVGALAMVLNVIPLDGPWRGVGTIFETPKSAEAVLAEYALSVGDINLRLDGLRLADGQQVRSGIKLGAGTITVYVPRTADLAVQCAADYGNVRCLQGGEDGQQAFQQIEDLGPDGNGGGRIDLDLRVSTGSVEVIRG